MRLKKNIYPIISSLIALGCGIYYFSKTVNNKQSIDLGRPENQ